MGINYFDLRFGWNYTANKEAVYPHIDKGKIGISFGKLIIDLFIKLIYQI